MAWKSSRKNLLTCSLVMIFTICHTTARAQDAELPNTSYFDILVKGTSAFHERSATAGNSAELVQGVVQTIQDALVANKVDEAITSVRSQISNAIKMSNGGVLIEVRIYRDANGIRYLVGGKPRILGIGASPAEAAAVYLSHSGLEVQPPKGTLRDSASYMIWATGADELKFDRIDHPGEMLVWAEGDKLRKRGAITKLVARSRDETLALAMRVDEYRSAAIAANAINLNAAHRARLQALENARIEAMAVWASALEAQTAADRQANQAAMLSGLSTMMSLISSGISYAESRTDLQRTLIDNARVVSAEEASAQAAQDAAAAKISAERARLEGLRTSIEMQRLRQVLKELRDFYREIPDFPIDRVPGDWSEPLDFLQR